MNLLHLLSGFPRTGKLLGLAAVLLAAGLAGCAQIGSMDNQPRYDPLEPAALFSDGRSARSYVEGTVPQTDTQVDDPAITGRTTDGEQVTGFPVEVNNELVQRGQERFAIYCTPCHGAEGKGDGMVVNFQFPPPPNLLEDPVKSKPTGHYFDVITNGIDLMFPYGYRVKPPDRWAIIAYIRALQLTGGQPAEELTPEELNQIGTQP